MRSNALALICSVVPFLHSCTAAPTGDVCQSIYDPHHTNASEIQAALKQSSIIPDGKLPLPLLVRCLLLTSIVLDDFTPSASIYINYPSSHSDVSLGNTFHPSAVQASPFFLISPLTLSVHPSRTLKPDTTYTLALTDPDATSRSNPTAGEYCHWIATNITLGSSPGEIKDVVFTPKFDELIPYAGPAPPPKTGYHRYVFVLLVPSSSIEALPNTVSTTGLQLTKPSERPHWGYGQMGNGVRRWAKDNDLVAVGANFFYAENDTQ